MLLDVCDPAEEFGCRNRAIIPLFLDTGMRYTELHRLTLAMSSGRNGAFISATARAASSGWCHFCLAFWKQWQCT